jgi:hypothetical protein
MVNISLQSLINILVVENGFKFVIEKVHEDGRNLYSFTSARGYPSASPFITISNDNTDYKTHKSKNSGDILLFYDVDMQMVTACADGWLRILKAAKSQLKRQVKPIKKDENKNIVPMATALQL